VKKFLVLLLILSVMSLGLVGCSQPSEESNTDVPAEDTASTTTEEEVTTTEEVTPEDQFITILTGGSSGAYFALGGSLANLLNKNLDYANASVESTGASAVNATKIGMGDAEIALAMNNVVSFAYNGVESFSDKGKFENLRGIAGLYPNHCQVVTLESSNVTQIEDLSGKNVGVGAPGSGTEVDARNILGIYGITYDDIDEDFLSYAESIEQLKNGTIDAAFLTSGLPNATILDLSTTHDVVIVPIRAEKVDELAVKMPYYKREVIAAGIYDNEEDVETAAVVSMLITREDLDEQVVYDITKTLFENLQTLRDTHSVANKIDVTKYYEGIPIPLHPGAERYFEEIGVLQK
jgi:TRAP transporter TAXI family solute receptor